MPRQSVADLLTQADQEAPAPPVLPPHPPAAEAPAAAVPAAALRTRTPARRPPRVPSESGSAELTDSQVPKWQRLERKELRLRADQLDELARLRRLLNRQRRGEGERITENTLIRVAVDLLLSRSADLRGTTEDRLRESVTS